MNRESSTIFPAELMLEYAYGRPDGAALERLRQLVIHSSAEALTLLTRVPFSKIWRGDYIRDPVRPKDDVEKVILYLEPPGNIACPERNEGASSLCPSVPVPCINWGGTEQNVNTCEEAARRRAAEERFLKKIWFKIEEYRESKLVAPWFVLEDSEDYLQLCRMSRPDLVKLRNRFGFNYQQAICALIAGYGQDKRRTGESIWIHPARVFFNQATQWVPCPENLFPALYLANLGMLLHDCQEDFAGFKILSPSADSSRKITFNKNGRTFEYPLDLTPIEAELLRRQVNALTAPIAKHLTSKRDAKRQFRHLEQAVQEILRLEMEGLTQEVKKTFAFAVLRGKVNDRLDNLFTYWESPGKKFKEKILETILFFRHLEAFSEQLFDAMPVSDDVSYSPDFYKSFLESAVNFCFFLLLGGTHDEAFQEQIDQYREEHKKHKLLGGESLSSFCLSFHLVLPRLYTTYSSATLY